MSKLITQFLQSQSNRLPIILILVSLAFSSPAILSGFVLDDYFMNSPLLPHETPFDYYHLIGKLQKAKYKMWYKDDSQKLRPFRPLSSLSLHIDLTYFGTHPIVAHLHSVAWFILLLLGSFRLFDLVLERRMANLAMLIYSLGIYHTMLVGWIAARHAVMGGTLAVWSSLFYWLWREKGERRDLIVCLGLLVLGLFISEVILTAVAFAVSIEFAYSADRLRNRMLAVSPLLIIAFCYLLLYKSFGYGASYLDGGYTDPFGDTGTYLRNLLPKGLTLLATFTLGIPVMIAMFGPKTLTASLGAFGLVLIVLAIFLCRHRLDAEERRLLLWLGLMASGTALPALTGMVDGRAAVLSGIAVTAILSILLIRLFPLDGNRIRRVIAIFIVTTLVIGVFILSPLFRFGSSIMLHQLSEVFTNMAVDSKISCTEQQDAFLLNNTMWRGWAPYLITAHRGFFFDNWYQLGATAGEVLLTRTTETTVEISAGDKTLLISDNREPGRFEVGWSYDMDDIKVTVLAMNGHNPTTAEFTIPQLSDEGSVCFMIYENEALKPVTIPPIGEALVIPPNPN